MCWRSLNQPKGIPGSGELTLGGLSGEINKAGGCPALLKRLSPASGSTTANTTAVNLSGPNTTRDPKAAQYLPADYWRFQLQTLLRYTPGAVIWSPKGANTDTGWVTVTQQFTQQLSTTKP